MADTGPNGRVSLSVSDGVAEIRLQHPEKRNSFSLELSEDFSEHLTTVQARDDVSVILITAEGPVFSGGADTAVLTEGTDAERDRLGTLLLDEICHELHRTTTPVVAGARGPAAGGGATVLCYGADFQVVSPSVEIWWPEVEYGAAPLGRAVYLANQIGESKTLELMLLGSDGKMSAAEAADAGLVTTVVDENQVEQRARDLARTIATRDEAYPGIVEAFVDAIHHARQEAYGTSIAYAHCQEDRFG
jgi:enoyl-CoA hydratase/carnithine racemase